MKMHLLGCLAKEEMQKFMRGSVFSCSVFMSLLLFTVLVSFLSASPLPTRFALAEGASEADDWSMFRHDAAHSGYSASTAPNTSQVLWSYATGGEVYSSPAVVDGRVYVGSSGNKTCCLNATTGKSIWNYTSGGDVYSSPAVVDGRVYISSGDYKIYCLNAATGAFIWSYTAGSWVFSPAIYEGKVYVTSWDSRVCCLNADSGALAWSYTATSGFFRSSPAVADGKVYVDSWDGQVTCLNAANGAFMWNYSIGNNLRSSPAVVDGKVYVGANDNKTYCLNAATGAFIWSYTTGDWVVSSPAVVDGKVYIGSGDKKFYCLDAATGALIWSYTTGGGVGSSPAVADGKVYVGSDGKVVYALNSTTGAFIWSYTTGGVVGSSPAVADGRVYIGSDDHKIYCFGLPAQSWAQTVTVPDDYPTIQLAILAARVGGTVYVRNGSYPETVSVNKPVALVGESRESTFITGHVEIIADNVTVTGFTASAGYWGSAISANNVKGINISQNSITGGNPSVAFVSVSNSTFSRNEIPPQYQPTLPRGLFMSLSSFNTFLWNNISSCSIVSSSNNSFSGNYIRGDGYHHDSYRLDISNSTNSWNATYPSGGNYWGATFFGPNYPGVDLKNGPNQDQPGGDGFGDTPYILNADNIDHYPLMRPTYYFTEGIPFAYFNYTPNKLAGETVTFDASASLDLNGNIVNYAWDFGDGVNATSASPATTHAYGNVHSNTVRLTVTDNEGLTDTSTQTVTVGMIPSALSISTSSSSMFAGFKVDVAGTLRDVYGNPLIGKTVVLSYTFSGISTWTPITSCTTDNAGNYLATWIPTATGAFTLKAEWSGTSTVSPANSNTTLNCLSYDQYVFSVESNSTISGLAYNAADHVLSFTATGSDGTKGYVKAAVAKNFTANPAGVKVLIDGNQVACSPTSTSDSCLIYFTYQHSTHSVAIDLSAATQPTPTPTPTTTPTPIPTTTPAPSPTPIPTPTPTQSPTPTPTLTSSPSPTPAPPTTLPSEIIYALVAIAIAAIAATAVVLIKKQKK